MGNQVSASTATSPAVQGKNAWGDHEDVAPEHLSCSSLSSDSKMELGEMELEDDEQQLVVVQKKRPLCDCSTTTSSSSRPNRVSSWLTFSVEESALLEENSLSDTRPVADLRTQPVWLVTTAALPWCTGTAMNPLLRAAYLLEYRRQFEEEEQPATRAAVHLVLPWLHSAADRVALYGEEWKDKTCADQTAYIRDWLTEQVSTYCGAHLRIHWYAARYHVALSSIFALGDALTLDDEMEPDAILILEEPEHLNYYRAPHHRLPCHTIGICHTNYKYYAQHGHRMGWLAAPFVAALSAGLVRAHCDQVIKLSGVLQDYAPHKQVVSNVHGIRAEFLDVAAPDGQGIYFIGKLLWAKGLDRLLVLQEYYRRQEGDYFAMDVYGSGPEQEEIKTTYLGDGEEENAPGASCEEGSSSRSKTTDALIFSWVQQRRRRRPLPVEFLGRKDHAAVGSNYKIFVNPSVSEVLCTTTAEAIAMGKFVIIPRHPSNKFFEDFPNALFYQSPDGFCEQLRHALTHAPMPLSPQLRHMLTWTAATERLFAATAVSQREAAKRQRLYGREDERWAEWHVAMSQGRRGDVIRQLLGGGPVAKQAQYQEGKVC